MPITTACTSCHARLNVGDDVAGKKIKCPRCGNIFRVVGSEDVTEELPLPPRKRASALEERSPRRAERDDEDDDDRPRRRSRSEDDDEDERPRSTKRSGSKAPLLIGIGVGAVVLIGAVIGLVIWLTKGADPVAGPTVIKLKDKEGKEVQVRIEQKQVDPQQDRHVVHRAKLPVLSLEVRNVHFPGRAPHLALVHIQPIPLEQGKQLDVKQQRWDLWDLKADKLLSTTPLGAGGLKYDDIQDISPDGSLVLNGQRFERHKASVYSLAKNQPVVVDWELTYARKNAKVQARWVKFVDEQRLLALYQDGAADLWNIADRQRTPLVSAILDERGEPDGRLSPEELSGGRRLRNYALSPDGRWFAQWTRTGFNLADTQAGKVRHTLPVQGNPKDIHRPEGIAFDPQGKFMAAIVRFEYRPPGQPGKNENVLCRWDLETGKSVHQAALAIPDFDGGHLYFGWWGKQHLLISRGNEGFFVDAGNGAYVGKYETHGSGGRILDLTADGNLAYLMEPGPLNKAHVLTVEAPVADLRPGMGALKITISGPQVK